MPEIVEGRLAFRFPDDWRVVKYDDPGGFAAREVRIDGTKKIDILALRPDTRLILLEIKDFRGHRIEARDRLDPQGADPLPVEIAAKVRDTVSVLLAAFRARDQELSPIAHYLFGGARREVEMILFLEQDPERDRKLRGYRDRTSLQTAVKRLLRPYHFDCRVLRMSGMDARAPWTVRSLPAGPQ